ncbi:MAG: zinc ABC transporter substrate-binding protein [Elusimicrobiaceae bacterium]|nr:zinc ABC transporter substrate-binding protein [Elusimicrobiaceae bacterium]
MKKGIFTFLLLFILGVFGWWWFGAEEKASPVFKEAHSRLKVVASGYVPYDLLRTIGGDKIELSQLIPAGAEPHHFEPTPGAIISIRQADLFVYISPEIEPWAADILKGMQGVQVVEAGPVLEGEDPHVWITPYGALAMAQEIEKALSHVDPKNKSYYRQNLKQFEKQIQSLHAAFKQGLARCKTQEMVHVGHRAFGALAHDYGLELHALSGTSHQGEHSVRRLAELVKLIKARQITAVFTEEMLAPDLARTVSAETGVNVLPLYTVHGVSKEDFTSGKTYLDFMRQNLANLQLGLQCQI